MSFIIGSNNTITLTRGDTFRAKISILYPDDTEYEPQEGDTVRFALKQNIKDPIPLIKKEVPIDSMVLTLNPEDTKLLDYGKYIYDVQLTKANGDVDTFITTATLKLTEEVD